ncbi:MAG: hypothetical protein HY282_15195 [Nitrospirae bacterium]|nr:hypothetical protein [Candidatus Manganitrophaceae bacterium]
MAEAKGLEKRIEKLKTKVSQQRTAAKGEAGGDRIALRKEVKKLKRAQRRKKTLQVRTAFIEAKGRKKVKGAEGDKPASS